MWGLVPEVPHGRSLGRNGVGGRTGQLLWNLTRHFKEFRVLFCFNLFCFVFVLIKSKAMHMFKWFEKFSVCSRGRQFMPGISAIGRLRKNYRFKVVHPTYWN